MDSKKISGLYAAVLTPRRGDDSVDAAALTRLIQFLISKGVSSFAINGATGEFCLTTPEQLRMLLVTVREASEGRSDILCGVGAPGVALAKQFAIIAQREGAQGLLLPMPYFFPYQQEDLDLYCREVAKSTDLPILLYNLPQFTSGLDKETVRVLITEVPNIMGIKDSSSSLEILRYLSTHRVDACRIVGNDANLATSLLEGICDGVVSGVACALPEIVLDLYGRRLHTSSSEFQHASVLLDEFIQQLDLFPTPWGIKWLAEARGIIPATFAQPVTAHRIAQGKQMIGRFQQWLPSTFTASESIMR